MERNKTSSSSEVSGNPTDDASGREPYETPRIVYREPMEAVATSCNPGKGTPAACPIGPVSS